MGSNNFQELMREDEENYHRIGVDTSSDQLWSTLSLFRLAGDLAEVFIPRVGDVIVMAAGGKGLEYGNEGENRDEPPPFPMPDTTDY